MKNFEFNAAVDDSLVSMDVPDGYALQETDLDLGNAAEEDFVESMRIWAEIIGALQEVIEFECEFPGSTVDFHGFAHGNIQWKGQLIRGGTN